MRTRLRSRRRGVSLLELIIALTIIGIMMSMILPALSGVRRRARIVECENNRRQLAMAFGKAYESSRGIVPPHRWTVALLPWIEQQAAADLLRTTREPEPVVPRSPLLQCPLQVDFPSRVENVSFCHYMLVVQRDEDNPRKILSWQIVERPKFTGDEYEEPWYVGPEIPQVDYWSYISSKEMPHPESPF